LNSGADFELAFSRKPETSPLFVPIEWQSRVIQEFARRQVGRMLSSKDCADNIRRQKCETKQPRHIGRDYMLRLGDFLQREALVREDTFPDHMAQIIAPIY